MSEPVVMNGGHHGLALETARREDASDDGTQHEGSHRSHDICENNNAQGPAENGDHVAVGNDVDGCGDTHADNAPVIDIVINNVVCTFGTRCHLNLKKIAMEGAHVEYKRENGMLNMKMRRPNTTATIWSSGKITCTGSTSEDEAKLAARRIARRLQRLGFNIRFTEYRVVNVLGTCSLPFGIKLNQFSNEFRANASYEPELHPGVTYRIKEPRATLKIFSTGSITVTAPCVLNVQLAIEHIYPLVNQFKMESTKVDRKLVVSEQKYFQKAGLPFVQALDDDEENSLDGAGLDEDEESEFSDEFDSDASQD